MYIDFDIPEIEEYQKGFPHYWVKVVFLGAFKSSYQLKALAITYIRLVEAALVEYRLGVSKLKEFWDTHDSVNIGAMNRSVSHFESCLSNMHRAIICFTRFRKHKDLPENLQVVFKNQRPRFVANQISDQLRNIRNDIHHLEELVMKGEVQQSQPFSLMPKGPEIEHPTEPNQTIKTIDRLVIAEREVLFRDISRWLKEMASFAGKIATYEEKNPKSLNIDSGNSPASS